ncbi:MAG: hypothetical protein H6834_05135 [Planctomycetes bacterium]|nr:hypothetical protein [Planctomycetota bacterium]
MSKNLITIGLPLALAAAGLAYLAFGPEQTSGAKVENADLGSAPEVQVAQPEEPAFKPLEVADTQARTAPPIEEAKDPFETKEEEDPWGHFKGKGPRNVPPDYVKDDGTLVWEKWPMKVKGKFVYGRMEAKPEAPMPILPEEIPLEQRQVREERAKAKAEALKAKTNGKDN